MASKQVLQNDQEVRPCVHCAKYKPDFAPKNNCTLEWDRYFLSHPERAAAVIFGLNKHGRAAVVSVMGAKYTKQVERFRKEHNLK